MFNYFLKGFNKCHSRTDVVHLSKQFVKNIYHFDTYEISLCLNKFSKANFQDKEFWNNVCRAITTTDDKVIAKFKIRKKFSKVSQVGERGGEIIPTNAWQNDVTDTYEKQSEEKKCTQRALQNWESRNDSNDNLSNNNTHPVDDDRKDKLLYHFNMEELCLVVNALAKVNVRNDEILKLASQKIITEFDLNTHMVNMIKAISRFAGVGRVGRLSRDELGQSQEPNLFPLEEALEKVYQNYNHVKKNLTERDICILIHLMLTKEIETTREEANEESSTNKNDLQDGQVKERKKKKKLNEMAYKIRGKLINSIKKINHISEQSIALILNACSKSCTKNKNLLDILKIIIILKLKEEKNTCSDIFVSSITHSYSSFYYRDKILYDTISEHVCMNIDKISVKALIIILNSFVNVDILNIKMFNASFNRLAKREVINSLSNQCTSNLITIITKCYSYLNTEKTHFILSLVKRRIRRDFARATQGPRGMAPISLLQSGRFIEDRDKNDGIRGDLAKDDGFRGDLAKDDGIRGDLAKDDGFRGDLAKDDRFRGYLAKDDRFRGNWAKPERFNEPVCQTKQAKGNVFIEGFLTQHLTNIINNLSKLNQADMNMFKIFSHLILKKKKEINKLDLMNITSAYARSGYVDMEMYELIKHYARKYLKNENLKYVEFINLFTSMGTFSLIEKNYKWSSPMEGSTCKFQDIICIMMNRLKGDTTSTAQVHGVNWVYHQRGDNNSSRPLGESSSIRSVIVTGCKKMSSKLPQKEEVQNERNDTHRSSSNYYACINERKNIIENLNIKHTCCILSTMSKLNTHDKQIYEECIKNLKKKIFKMDSRCLTMYLLYVSKFNITPDRYIRDLISKCFKFMHFQNGNVELTTIQGDKNGFLNKMKNLHAQLQTEDIVNAVYIIRSLIKNNIDYRSSMYIIYAYLQLIYRVVISKSRCKNKQNRCREDQNIIKLGESQHEEPIITTLIKNRKLNTQTACILMNSLAFLNTHIYFQNEEYSKMLSWLLLFSFKFMFDKLDIRQESLDKLLYPDISQKKEEKINEIKNIIKKKIDSASIRQLNMTILMSFHFYSFNIFFNSPKWKMTSNLASYPLNLLKYFYFFLKYTPFTHFEKYSSIYNLMNNTKKFINYFDDVSSKIDSITPYMCHKNNNNNTALLTCSTEPFPTISKGEMSIYRTVRQVLKKNNCQDRYIVLSTLTLYMYSVDLLIVQKCQETNLPSRNHHAEEEVDDKKEKKKECIKLCR
ncbi:hypothetical protein, conserved [Plasmodium gonderi]|uniref:Uncharacterized protein n=1 Tax=Plasmodium gonderi TaxID=77519 RepID=A0A1Y1JJU6_PLAGO|nr:hypothetical protein, conserved [Plasmodium gonderi]GAW81938.1 hypothetical protein, conserved [Plasmodium gonderi]